MAESNVSRFEIYSIQVTLVVSYGFARFAHAVDPGWGGARGVDHPQWRVHCPPGLWGKYWNTPPPGPGMIASLLDAIGPAARVLHTHWWIPNYYLLQNICITLSLILLPYAVYVYEARVKNAGYSKFAPATGLVLPSRTGMVLLYSLPMVVALYAGLFECQSGRGGRLPSLLLTLHFLKRVLEANYLHAYSGNLSVDFLPQGATSYCFHSALMIAYGESVPVSSASSLALFLFVVGEGGNLYHHWLLAGLRGAVAPGEATPRYLVPRGGFFELVACPHYFFEILALMGVSLSAQNLGAIPSTIMMAGYLAGRAQKTSAWYREKLKEAYPASRRHMVPWVF